MSTETPAAPAAPSDFIRDIVAQHVADGRYPKILTRFPPEPNGYLHIGHAKSICLNFGIAREFGGMCNLRMDDTNPTKEDIEYVESIIFDVNWLIGGWADGVKTPKLFHASDYFEQLYSFAKRLIQKGKAYVCDLTGEQIAEFRGAPGEPGRPSPNRDRSVEENLDLLTRMCAGEFADGTKTLRAKIDMASPNIHLRDPVIYRIRHTEHQATGNAWCIYPMYDYAHCLSDAIEGISHSICTLEFEVHRPLYDWLVDEVGLWNPRPRQYEFARLSLTYTLMSKRKLLQLVEENLVTGWDDPRMPTICGMRRRGVTAQALRNFAYHIGVTKYMSLTDVAVLEHAIREDLNKIALRRMAVLRPLKVVITNFPEGKMEPCAAVNNPGDETAGTREIPFTRELWIEQDDFMEVPAPKYFRLKPGGEVRLKAAFIIKCDEVVKDAAGNVTELHCTADLDSKTGGPTAGRKVKGTIHWVSAEHALEAEVRLYDRLFTESEPEKDGRDFKTVLNPHSLEIITAKVEPSLRDANGDARYQFERLAYFTLDSDSKDGAPIFNRTITLKDAWAREAQRG
ncbi:MAG: glutamine--tRNA ligase/YqeY domain fusion protein [Chthoniobacteraceae bacterium]